MDDGSLVEGDLVGEDTAGFCDGVLEGFTEGSEVEGEWDGTKVGLFVVPLELSVEFTLLPNVLQAPEAYVPPTAEPAASMRITNARTEITRRRRLVQYISLLPLGDAGRLANAIVSPLLTLS